MTAARRSLAFCALGVVLAFTALGVAATHGATLGFDRACATLLFGRAPAFARTLALTGYVPWLVAASAIGFAAVRVLGGRSWLPFAIVATQLISQGLVEAIKGVFARARPEHFIGVHEAGFSYPSGHATTAVVFYGAWTLAMASAPIRGRFRGLGCAVLLLWSVVLGLSRIALGAHYASDVVGGTLLGAACLALATAIALPHLRRGAVV